ncbi:DUF7521 family protein [Halomontanus rarus]|uniref:DUF7521 family protein n=1 Tax=Halomontanus rarus TaxID=3034020 RepID=UPI0023E7A7EB|nr:hypothetical protein [Halovivax sp. TS33]
MNCLMSPSVQTLPMGLAFVGILIFIGKAIAFVLACWIAYRAISGYRSVDDPTLLWLALGIVLLSVVPTIVRFLLPTAGVTAVVTTLTARTCELAGLISILYSIYGRT